MDNYQYIIGSLPYLVLDYSGQSFSYKAFAGQIKEGLSKKDLRLVDWLEFSMQEEHLTSHFYRGASKSKCRFLREYFTFDHKIRNIQVKFLSKKLGKDENLYTVGTPDTEFEEYPELMRVLENPNVIEREQSLDHLRWDKISGITTYNYFDIDVILAFLAKAKIVQRWIDMDKAAGAKLFEQFVGEVRGTFNGINF